MSNEKSLSCASFKLIMMLVLGLALMPARIFLAEAAAQPKQDAALKAASDKVIAEKNKKIEALEREIWDLKKKSPQAKADAVLKAAHEEMMADRNAKIGALQKEISGLKKESAALKEKLAAMPGPPVNDLNPQVKKENEALTSQLKDLKAKGNQEQAYLYRQLGAAYLKLKMHDEAFDAYLKSISLNPDDPQANYQLGLLYRHEKGDKNKAVGYLKKYLELDPKAENREDVKYLIKMMSQSVTFTQAEAEN